MEHGVFSFTVLSHQRGHQASQHPADGAWAPEVHRYRGKFYLFVTLHNNNKLLDEPTPVTHPVYQGKPATHHLRGTQIFIADSPDGPFGLLGKGGVTPPDFMALDGTFYVENGIPYMIYAHEWIQTLDGEPCGSFRLMATRDDATTLWSCRD